MYDVLNSGKIRRKLKKKRLSLQFTITVYFTELLNLYLVFSFYQKTQSKLN